jgi:hypothetical protein
MTADRAPERIELQLDGGYNRNAMRPIMGELAFEPSQDAVDAPIRELDLGQRPSGSSRAPNFAGLCREPSRRRRPRRDILLRVDSALQPTPEVLDP